MEQQRPRISDAEWQVMKALWQKSPATSSEIIDILKPDVHWKPKTIHTLINRLVQKKAVGVYKNTPQYYYYPLVSEKESQRIETRSFLQKVYDGSFNLLVSNFIKEEKLTPEEIEELKSLLEEKGRE